MKNKFRFLTKMSLKKKINTKWFKIVNVILCIGIILLSNIDTIIKKFGGDFNESIKVYIIDSVDGNVYDIFKSQISNSSSLLTYDGDNLYDISIYDKTLEDAKKEVSDNDKLIVLEFNKDINSVINVTFLSKEYMDLKDMSILNTAINNTKVTYAINEYNINPNDLTKIYEPVQINRIFLDNQKNDSSENTKAIMTTVFPIIILPFFILSIMLVQMIGAEVNDEKTSKSMEIIISNVSPEIHLASKIVAGNLFVLFQVFLLTFYSILGVIIRRFTCDANIMSSVSGYLESTMNSLGNTSFMDSLIIVIPMFIILLLISFVMYSLIAGILASMTTNIEDFQQLQSPIIIISLLGYYLALLSGIFKGSLFIKILSYFPFVSAILSPSLFLLGEVNLLDVVISILICLIFIYLLIKYGIRIYKVGILNYSSKDLWKKMYKAIKQK